MGQDSCSRAGGGPRLHQYPGAEEESHADAQPQITQLGTEMHSGAAAASSRLSTGRGGQSPRTLSTQREADVIKLIMAQSNSYVIIKRKQSTACREGRGGPPGEMTLEA